LEGFDMSQQAVIWFAKSVARNDSKRTDSKKAGTLRGEPMLTRRDAIAGLAGGLSMLNAPRSPAQAAYPSRIIKLVVPYPAGGTTDLLGRLIADRLERACRHSHCGEQAGGGNLARRRAGGALSARRLHASAGDLDHARRQPDTL
jgi:hypothetical protein